MTSANQCLPAQIKTAKTYITTKMIASAETGFSTALVLLICNLNHVSQVSLWALALQQGSDWRS